MNSVPTTHRQLGPLMLDLASTVMSVEEAERLLHPAVGGVILFTRNYAGPDQLAALVQSIRAVRSELLVAADTEGGRVQRFRKGFLRLPALARYGALYAQAPEAALETCEAGGWLLAAELRAVDIDLAFSPVVDVDRGVSQIIGDRAFGQDAAAVTALAKAHARGLRAAGMAATAKHFPGHGYVAPDSHKELPEDERSMAQITAHDLQPYTPLFNDGLESVMVAHVRYAQVDQLPASISPVWIQDVLRTQLAFAGAVFSDDLSMGGLGPYGDVVARMCAALAAGCDMVPVCNRPQEVAELLARWDEVPASSAHSRLASLRGTCGGAGLSLLRVSDEYLNNVSSLRNYIDVEIEV